MQYRIKVDEGVFSFKAEKKEGRHIALSCGGRLLDVEYSLISDHQVHMVINGSPVNAYLAREGGVKTVIIRGVPYTIADADDTKTRARGKIGAQAIPQDITPPMPAVVVRILVSAGDRVKQGDKVIVVSSMKMETTLTAPSNGTVKAVNVAEGDKVMPGQVLIDIDKDDAVSAGDRPQPG